MPSGRRPPHHRNPQTGATTNGAYAYDAFAKLAQRIVTTGARSGARQYLYDQSGHVMVETDQNGVTLREYIWLNDEPIALIDHVNTTPALDFIHVDHLNRPILITNATRAPVWSATWKPFGEAYAISGTLTENLRFPGQLFQIESGLHWNWHRHYDPTTGTYLQVDPYTTELGDEKVLGTQTGLPFLTGFVGKFQSALASNESLYRSDPTYLADILHSTIGMANAAPLQTRDVHLSSGTSQVAESNSIDVFRYTGQAGNGTGVAFTDYQLSRDSPSWGRFVSEDRITIGGGAIIYNYANNSPTELVDPTGETWTGMRACLFALMCMLNYPYQDPGDWDIPDIPEIECTVPVRKRIWKWKWNTQG